MSGVASRETEQIVRTGNSGVAALTGPWRILMVEDDRRDAELMAETLQEAGCDFRWSRVDTEADFQSALDRGPDIVLSDYHLPEFNGFQALSILQQRQLDIPFILVSGAIGEESAAEAIRRGASDYLLKDRLMRLPAAVATALEQRQLRAESRLAEKELLEANRRLIAFFHHSPSITFIKDVSGRYLQVNERFNQAFGFTPGQVIGKRDGEIFPPREAAASCESDRTILRGDQPNYFEEILQQVDGPHTCVVAKFPIHDAHGAICGIGGIATDITERERAEAALREREAEFRVLAEAMPQIVWITRPDGWNVYFNQRWIDYTGLTLAESCGHGWITPFHPQDRQRAWDAWQQATATVGAYSIEARLRRADGAYRWWLVRGVPLKDAAGNVLKWFGTCTDIHDLKAAEDRFRATFENAAVGIAHTALDGRFLLVNNKLAEMLGYTPAELLALTTRDIAHPRDLPTYGLDSKRMLAGDIRAPGFASEKRFVQKAGTEIWARRTVSLVRDDQGQPLYFIRVIEDISDRKHAEETARRERAMLRAILDTIPEGIHVKDRQGRIVLHNPSSIQFCGAGAPDDIVGKTVFDLFPIQVAAALHADDEQTMESGVPVLNREEPEVADAASPAGTYGRWNLTSKIPLEDEAGNVYGLVVITHDITERKRIETALLEAERFSRSTIDALTLSLCVLDETGTIIRVNKQWRDFASANGADPASVSEGVNYLEACDAACGNHDVDALAFASGLRSVLADERPEFKLEYACHSPNARRWFLGRVSQFKSEGRKRLVVTHANITTRKEAEMALLRLNDELEAKIEARTQALIQARREAEEASRAKSQFLATMSHEIRTPLNGVIGMMDVLQQTSLRDDQIEMVDLIRESAFSLLGIISDILDFSKIEAGKLELEREAFAIESVVDSVGSLLNGMAQKNDVTLTLFVDPAIPAQVIGDALRLRQVLINLTNNAIKFSSGQPRAGRVSVRALLVEHSPHQVMVELQVTDNGIGMDEDARTRLFTAFSQADASTTRRFGGTGLGLAIVHRLVKLMGGEIRVHSAAGEGATFKLRLPFVPLPEQANSKASPSEVAGLSCVVVGNAGGLADDLATYLVHAQARVVRETDLAGAIRRQAGRNDSLVWIVDAGDDPQPPEQVHAVAQIEQDVRFAVVLVERGKRRCPRAVAADTIMVDGNALSRSVFFKAVAIATGRASGETEAVKPSHGRSAAIAPSREEALRERRLILVAEDNEINQKVIVRQLALLGYTADVAADGREALERWKSGDYVLLFTDLHMPHVDGYELTQAIRAQEAHGTHTPIIALTANALNGESERCHALGMDDYRSKPVPLSELQAVLDQWLPARPAAGASVASPPAAAVARHSATATPVDVDVLRELVGDDPQVIEEFLIDFGQSAATMAEEMRAACAANQPAAAAAAAHKLKSSARAVGAFALAELCEAIEYEGKDSGTKALVILLLRLEKEMAALNDYLETYQYATPENSRGELPGATELDR